MFFCPYWTEIEYSQRLVLVFYEKLLLSVNDLALKMIDLPLIYYISLLCKTMPPLDLFRSGKNL